MYFPDIVYNRTKYGVGETELGCVISLLNKTDVKMPASELSTLCYDSRIKLSIDVWFFHSFPWAVILRSENTMTVKNL